MGEDPANQDFIAKLIVSSFFFGIFMFGLFMFMISTDIAVKEISRKSISIDGNIVQIVTYSNGDKYIYGKYGKRIHVN